MITVTLKCVEYNYDIEICHLKNVLKSLDNECDLIRKMSFTRVSQKKEKTWWREHLLRAIGMLKVCKDHTEKGIVSIDIGTGDRASIRQ